MTVFQRSKLSPIVVLTIMSFAACAALVAPEQPPVIPLVISDIQTVAGKWEGMVIREPFQRDWAELTIHEDGRFEYVSHRNYLGIAKGGGMLKLTDGKLTSETERAQATYVLMERSGRRVLMVDALSKQGLRYTAELTRAE
jgi:hypothetical protein